MSYLNQNEKPGLKHDSPRTKKMELEHYLYIAAGVMVVLLVIFLSILFVIPINNYYHTSGVIEYKNFPDTRELQIRAVFPLQYMAKLLIQKSLFFRYHDPDTHNLYTIRGMLETFDIDKQEKTITIYCTIDKRADHGNELQPFTPVKTSLLINRAGIYQAFLFKKNKE